VLQIEIDDAQNFVTSRHADQCVGPSRPPLVHEMRSALAILFEGRAASTVLFVAANGKKNGDALERERKSFAPWRCVRAS